MRRATSAVLAECREVVGAALWWGKGSTMPTEKT